MSIRFRFGLAVGFALGYYLGARAGEERYKQIRHAIERASRSELVDKAKAAVDLGVERLRDMREERTEGTPATTEAPLAS